MCNAHFDRSVSLLMCRIVMVWKCGTIKPRQQVYSIILLAIFKKKVHLVFIKQCFNSQHFHTYKKALSLTIRVLSRLLFLLHLVWTNGITLHIIILFSCFDSFGSHHTVCSCPNQLISWWNEPTCCNTSHMRTHTFFLNCSSIGKK